MCNCTGICIPLPVCNFYLQPPGIRGLCNGLGPAMYGLIFYLFHVDLNEKLDGTTVEVDTWKLCFTK